MNRQIYVNLPVRDLPRSRTFFSALGFTFNEQYSDAKAACMVVAEHSYVMLLTEPFFAGFTHKPVIDARQGTEVLVCLSCRDRDEVDDLVRRACAAGGQAPRAPQELGFMFSHGFDDLDGHIWELVAMTPADQEAARPTEAAPGSVAGSGSVAG